MPKKTRTPAKAAPPAPGAAAAPPVAPAPPPLPPSPVEKKGPANKHAPSPQTRNLVELAMLNDMTHEQTAQLVGIDAKTLRVHYADELEQGKLRMLSRVSANLYRIASQQQDIKAALTASIFLLKSKGGYNDRAAEATAVMESAGPVRFTLRLGDRPSVN